MFGSCAPPERLAEHPTGYGAKRPIQKISDVAPVCRRMRSFRSRCAGRREPLYRQAKGCRVDQGHHRSPDQTSNRVRPVKSRHWNKHHSAPQSVITLPQLGVNCNCGAAFFLERRRTRGVRYGSDSASRSFPKSRRARTAAFGRPANGRSWRLPAIGGRVRFTGGWNAAVPLSLGAAANLPTQRRHNHVAASF
jgi:hypothetical protein